MRDLGSSSRLSLDFFSFLGWQTSGGFLTLSSLSSPETPVPLSWQWLDMRKKVALKTRVRGQDSPIQTNLSLVTKMFIEWQIKIIYSFNVTGLY